MSKRAVTIDDLLQFKLVSDPQISEDGKRILFGIKQVLAKNKAVSQLYTVDHDGKVTQLTQGEKSAGAGRWVPGSSAISFVSARGGAASQIYLLPESGEAHALTELEEGSIGGYKWSPDGKYVAFTFRPAHADFSEQGTKDRKDAGLSDAPWCTESLWYRLDGDGYFGEQRYELHLLNVETREVKPLLNTSAHGSYDFAWSPKSDQLAVIRSAEKEPFAANPNDQIYLVDLGGKESMIPGLPKGNKEAVAWSPDGAWLTFAGDVDENDPWGTRNSKLYVVKPSGEGYRDLTGHQDYDLEVATLSDTKEAAFGAVLFWAPDSQGVYVQVGTFGETHIGYVSLAEGGIKLLTSGKCSHGMGNISPSLLQIPYVYGDPLTIPEIGIFEIASGATKVLTSLNQAWLDSVELTKTEEHWLDTPDGTKVHTWIMKPAKPNGAAVLEVHGGPHTQYGWVFFHEFQVLAASGYTVVYSNPRGSKGYGEAHCKAIQGDWGNKDWIDIVVVKNWMQTLPGVDAKRLGIMGGSYGGYMTNWAIGHTHDFRAAITDRCVSNMVSMAGNSDFPFNKDGYFKGVAWGSLEDIRELWRQSPIAYFTEVKTPTLIIHSEGDLRCNVEQGEQVFTALKMQGIDARFVRYPKSTSHGMSRSGPADLRMHRLNEIVSWWAKYLA
jgi:dipeptidyl aminopeptidase/acylaminoacyl peptidase